MTASKYRRWIRNIAIVCAMPPTAFGAYVGVLQLRGNFHTVVPGEVYRSAQPTAAEISRYVNDYGIHSVINLRGAAPSADWYRDEVAGTEAKGIQHFDYRMSARTVLDPTQAEELIALMRKAPKPVLIHCQWGADRSGLAAALYLLTSPDAEDEKRADSQLSLFFGHLSLPFAAEYAMDISFERLEPLFRLPKSAIGDLTSGL